MTKRRMRRRKKVWDGLGSLNLQDLNYILIKKIRDIAPTNGGMGTGSLCWSARPVRCQGQIWDTPCRPTKRVWRWVRGSLCRSAGPPGPADLQSEFDGNFISRSRCSQDLQDFVKIMADCLHLQSDSEPGADTVGIYVENHEGRY